METSGKKPDLSKYGEPIEHVVLWPGQRFGLDLINVLTIGTVFVPSVVGIFLIIQGWLVWVRPVDVVMLVVGLLSCGLGITIGFHRLFTHGAFRAKPWVRGVFGILGCAAMQGPILFWCSSHREHHQHSDSEGDPHSPHLDGDTWLGRLRGFIHAHVGWIVYAGNYRYKAAVVRDLHSDPVVRWVDDRYPLWAFLGLSLPALIGGLWDLTVAGAIMGFVWGGLVRLMISHHVTFAINSVGHLVGTRRFETHDESRNNWLLGVLALGEGWHNNHHAFPQSARHGLDKGEPDLSYTIIRWMEKLGWAWKVRLVTDGQIRQKLKGR